MKKYGFTLAEVLIALGIIGVISSLTAPTFIANIQNNSNAARLSATVSTLDNAFTTMIAKEEADTLFETEAWNDYGSNRREFASKIGDYMTTVGYREFLNTNAIYNYYGAGKGPFVMTSTGSKNNTVNNQLAGYFVRTPFNNIANGNHAIELKNGAMVFLIVNDENGQNPDEESIRQQGGSLYKIAADIWIDVNGAASPNTLGRDIFAFYLGDNGKLYPLGGKDVETLDTPDNPQLWNEANSSRRCLDGNIADGGYGCTARVIADGYKINY